METHFLPLHLHSCIFYICQCSRGHGSLLSVADRNYLFYLSCVLFCYQYDQVMSSYSRHHCDVVFELWLLQIHSICSSASSQGCRKIESAKLIEMKVLLLQSPLVVAACDNISLCRWLHHLPASHPVTCHVSRLHTASHITARVTCHDKHLLTAPTSTANIRLSWRT